MKKKFDWLVLIPIVGTIIEMIREHRNANKDIRELRRDIRICKKKGLSPESYVNTTYEEKDLAWKEFRINAIQEGLDLNV